MPRVTKVNSISFQKLWGKIAADSNMRKLFADSVDSPIYNGTNLWEDEYNRIKGNPDVIYQYEHKTLSANYLFKALHISTETLYAMKQQQNISLGVIDKFCSYFQCQPEDIMEVLND